MRSAFPLVLVAAVAVSSCAVSCSPVVGPRRDADAREAREELLEELAEETAEAPRFDQPDAAEAYYRARRQVAPGGVAPMEAYRRASARVAAMPRFSSRLGRMQPELAPRDAAAAVPTTLTPALGTWESVGPGNIGGRTRVLLVDPTDANILYAAGVSGGVWKSEDAGAGWRPLSDALANITVNAMVMDPTDPNVIYAGTGEGYFREIVRGTGLPLRGAGIFKTEDGGESWEFLASTAGEGFYWVNDLVISPHDHTRLYAATRTGVYRSPDAGTSWERILDPAVYGGCLDLAGRPDLPGDALFAACGSFQQARVWRNLEAEGDSAWTPVLTEAAMGRTSLAISASNPSVIYALAASNQNDPHGGPSQAMLAVFRSTAGGEPGSWQARVRNTTADPVAPLLLSNPVVQVQSQCWAGAPNSYSTMGWYVNVIAVDPTDENRVWAAGVDLFRSEDGGATWRPASYWWQDEFGAGFMHADQHGITFHPGWDGLANQTMFVVNDGGVYRTDNALAPLGSGVAAICEPRSSQVVWQPLNHSYGVTQFYHGAPFDNGRRYLGGTQDNGTISGDDASGGNAWFSLFGGDGGYVAVDPTDPRYVYLETQWFAFRRSTDGGLSFDDRVAGVTDSSASFLFITPFVLDPNEPRRLWAGGRRVWRTDNRAGTWTAASTALNDGGRVTAIAVAPGRPDRVLVGTEYGTIYRNESARQATATTTWTAVAPREGWVSSLAFDPANASIVYATYAGFGGTHIWRSRDAGVTWSPLDGVALGALPDIPVHCLVVDGNHAGRLYLGTDLGVFVSTDTGLNWRVENTGFSQVVTEWLALTHNTAGDSVLFAFTHGRGAWRVVIPPDGGGGPRPPRRRI